MKKTLLIVLFLSSFASAQNMVKNHTITKRSNFRGLAAYSENGFWICGSNGAVGRSEDETVKWCAPDSTLDFRSIHAWDSLNAIVANAGSPAYIFKTSDGGKSWKKVYEDRDSLAFIDAIAFRKNNKEGYALGDPVDGRFTLIRTLDRGTTWEKVIGPEALKGEAAFAASNSSMVLSGDEEIYIATGGIKARLLISSDNGKTWNSYESDIISGNPSQGIFSIAKHNNRIYLTGGDYKNEKSSEHTFSIFDLVTKKFLPVTSFPSGYRSSIIVTDKDHIITTGPSGTEICKPGVTFSELSKEGFNIGGIYGNSLFLAGKSKLIRIRL